MCPMSPEGIFLVRDHESSLFLLGKLLQKSTYEVYVRRCPTLAEDLTPSHKSLSACCNACCLVFVFLFLFNCENGFLYGTIDCQRYNNKELILLFIWAFL